MDRCEGSGERRRLATKALVVRGGEKKAKIRCKTCDREFETRYTQPARSYPQATVPSHKAP